ncbi:MAG: hypothetical protein ACK5Q5_13980 [Planctomycetaceae bacterium]
MWINTLVILSTPGLGSLERRILNAAMVRRGWEQTGVDSYSTSFTNPGSDADVVKLVEQDVKAAVYVAGVDHYDAVCLISDGERRSSFDSGFETQDSDLNLGSL